MKNNDASGGPSENNADEVKRLEKKGTVAEGRLITFINDLGQPIYLPPPKIAPEFKTTRFSEKVFMDIPPNYKGERVLNNPPENFWTRWKTHKKELRAAGVHVRKDRRTGRWEAVLLPRKPSGVGS